MVRSSNRRRKRSHNQGKVSMRYHLTPKSENEKTGPIPVSTTSRESCPSSCPFINKGCYAKTGPLGWHWNKVTDGRNPNATNLKDFTAKVAALPVGQVWRHNQAGDLPGKNETIDNKALRAIVKANKGKRGFTYTHKPLNKVNARAIASANAQGFTINLSANNLVQADQYKALNIAPVVVVVPEDTARLTYTPAGNKVVICPAQQKDSVTCASCKLCSLQRDAIIGFRAHGTTKNTVNAIVKG